VKAEKIKDLGSPIQLAGIALAIVLLNGCAWIGENTHVAKKIDLEARVPVLSSVGRLNMDLCRLAKYFKFIEDTWGLLQPLQS
jgi:hypothetical protein